MEFRTFEFREQTGDDAPLVETAESKELRRQKGAVIKEEKEAELNRTAKKTVEDENMRAKQAKV